MPHRWIHDILADLSQFARLNGMARLAEHLDQGLPLIDEADCLGPKADAACPHVSPLGLPTGPGPKPERAPKPRRSRSPARARRGGGLGGR